MRSVSFFIFLLSIRRPPRSTLFPYTTLFRSVPVEFCCLRGSEFLGDQNPRTGQGDRRSAGKCGEHLCRHRSDVLGACAKVDRKSTRLNSSHVEISYAVFCLKKKKIKES